MKKEQITVTNNSVCNSAENKGLEGKGMKRRLLHFKKRMVPAVSGVLMGVMLMSTTCFAAGTGTSAVTQPLENLKTLIIAVIGAVGVIILAKNVMEFAQAYQQQDSSTMNSALKGIVAGHDGWYFNSSDILRLLRLGKCISPFSKRKEVNNKYGYF